MQDTDSLSFYALNAEKADKIEALAPNSSQSEQRALFKAACHAAVASPYLYGLMHRETEFFQTLFDRDSNAILNDLWAEMDAFPCEETDRTATMRFLRQCKRRAALALALYDMGKSLPQTKVTEALSTLAEKAVQIALKQAYNARANGKEEHCTPLHQSGLFILALGKLGGRELNYSSDIDLVAFFEPGDSVSSPTSDSSVFQRIVRDVIDTLERRTEDGYVFRTDFRLRPDPGATPLVMSTFAAESYYHSIALNWERAAMIKARFIAGDAAASEAYMARLSPWVWRRSMDYTALADIAALKERSSMMAEQEDKTFVGYNVKLGAGGIREIEFYAQIHQLLFGGRDPSIRQNNTLEALRALSAKNLIDAAAARDLCEAYIFLRDLEHRIQMLDDDQSHTVPEGPKLEALAHLFDLKNPQTLAERLTSATSTVRRHYQAMLPRQTERPALYGEALLDLLAQHGFENPQSTSLVIETWRRGRYRALRRDKARYLLEELLPGLLHAFAGSEHPDHALARFDRFLRELPSGVQLFSLLAAHPWLFSLLTRVVTVAPHIAETLARRPVLWDYVLNPEFFIAIGSKDKIADDVRTALSQAEDYQDRLDRARRMAADFHFRLGVHLLEGLITAREAGVALTAFAEATLEGMLRCVEQEYARSHGRIEGAALVLVAMGQLGAGALTLGADLDLVMLYSGDVADARSDGRRSQSANTYFAGLGQMLITAMEAPTSEGKLFTVDTRLRPSGAQGPLVVTLERFRRYYSESAWTWEHMALTRARVLPIGDGDRKAATIATNDALSGHRQHTTLRTDVAAMRAKLRDAYGSKNPLNVKHTPGGLVDIDFIVQFLMLQSGAEIPGLFTPDLSLAITQLSDHGLLQFEDAETISKALAMQQELQAYLRLCYGDFIPEMQSLSGGFKTLLRERMGYREFDELLTDLKAGQRDVFAVYKKIVDSSATIPADNGAITAP